MSVAPQVRGGSSLDPPTDNLKRRTVQGAVFIYASQAVRLLAQIVGVIVLSRLLPPSEFGLFAMVSPVYGFALMFQDLGLSQAAVQQRQITPAQISMLFWANLAIGCCLALLLVLVAPAIGEFYGDPRATDLTRGFAVLVVVSAVASQHLALINRRMHFRYLAVLDAVAYALGLLGGLILAVAIHNHWALFAVPFITTAATAIGAWLGTGFVPSRPRREHGVRQLLTMGSGFMAFNLFSFIARNLDNVLIGHAWGGAALGLYDRAYKLLLFPMNQFSTPLARIMLPALARLQDDPARYRLAFLRATQQLQMVTQPGIVFSIATADTLVPALLGEKWQAAVPIFQWLGFAAVQQMMTASANWLFVSQGRSKEYMRWGAFNAATSTAAFFAGLPWGPTGVAAAYSITQFCVRMPAVWWMATRHGPVRLADICGTAIPYAAASAASFVAVIALRGAFALDTIPGLIASLVVSYAAAILALAMMPQGRAMLRQSVSLLGSLRRQ